MIKKLLITFNHMINEILHGLFYLLQSCKLFEISCVCVSPIYSCSCIPEVMFSAIMQHIFFIQLQQQSIKQVSLTEKYQCPTDK